MRRGQGDYPRNQRMAQREHVRVMRTCPQRPRGLLGPVGRERSLLMDPSMSWSWLLLECSYAFSLDFMNRTSGEPARFGSGYHDLIAAKLQGITLDTKVVAKKWG